MVGYFSVDDGYGSMTEYIVLGAERAGAVLNVIPLGVRLPGLTSTMHGYLARSRTDDLLGSVIFHAWPGRSLDRYLGRPGLIVSTMNEADKIPERWPERLNLADAVITPSRFGAKVFQACGVTAPIEVVPDGVDPEVYQCISRPDRPITTLIVGMNEPRKNIDVGIEAWRRAFGNDADARLIIKSKNQLYPLETGDSRITYVDTNEMTRGIVDCYRDADVLLALGNEGFGLPLIEGMATGLPVIALNSEGQSDVCTDADGLLLPVSPVRWKTDRRSGGAQGIPDPDDVARCLRWVVRHRHEAREMGGSASKWVHKYRNVWQKGPAMVEIVREYSTVQ